MREVDQLSGVKGGANRGLSVAREMGAEYLPGEKRGKIQVRGI